ncbi:MAG: hypothetical protein ABS92_13705 [Thiobacillus sp. SCN 63-374]|nr:MAG: hypothetical protein ABS92_13705 [Thiobacillus sp. SCN 63-374]
MQRAAREKCRALQQRKRWLVLARAQGIPADARPANFFRKHQRIGGCGKARCWLCHGGKLAQHPTPQTRRAAARFAEAMRTLGTLPA